MGHNHPHEHVEISAEPNDTTDAMDLSIADGDLSPAQLSRRGLMRGVGLLGAGAAAASVLNQGTPAHANGEDRGWTGELRWLAGDHHIHTQYSSDAMYRVVDQARHAHAYGLDWMVVTDHGSNTHARIGVEKVNPDVRAAREELRDLLIYQGLEWNIPAAEHGTVFVHPGRNEVAVLKEFENGFDGTVKAAGDPTPGNEALATQGIQFLGNAVRERRVEGALFLANHPARRGVDSPHEFRNWRDADPTVAIGMEGAPGHQAAGIAAPVGPGSGRGFYAGAPSANSFPGYPLEAYRTWGGFDFFTSTVGGLWDSLLAEGKTWWITANSDSHANYLDTSARGPDSNFELNGKYNDPVYGGVPLTSAGDFWPGYYSRTHVGATSPSYRGVLEGLRSGRVWVDHGSLVRSLDIRARSTRDRGRTRGVSLGGVLNVRRGTEVELTIDIDLPAVPNWAQFVPKLARVDVIAGAITGPVSDKDVFTAPQTKVVKSYEVAADRSKVSFTYSFGAVDQPFYVRVRGTDGKRSAAGYLGTAVDPNGPAMDVLGNADPWNDLWFYANPIFVLPL